MIIDQLQNAGFYYGMGEQIKFALEYLREQPLPDMEPGRFEIRGSDMFLLIQHYEGRRLQDGFWEAHRKYLDIQYIFEGAEKMGVAPLESLAVTKEYREDKDVMVLDGSGDFITVKEGAFVLFFPQDAHMPCLAVDKPEPIKKAVIKIRIS